MNGKVATIVGILAFAVLFMGTQAFATQMSSKSVGDNWASIRPDVPETYAYNQNAPCLAYCSAEDFRVYSYYGEGHSFSFSKIASEITMPKVTMKAPAGSERPDVPEMYRGEVPTWY
jgi:hypothetical protein